MDTKLQKELEQIYEQICLERFEMKDKEGNPFRINDIVRFIQNPRETFKVVGWSTVTEKVQLEKIQHNQTVKYPYIIYVKPSQIIKITTKK